MLDQPFAEMIIKPIVSEGNTLSPPHPVRPPRQLSPHINVALYHRMREDRFIESQKRVLQKQHLSMQRAREFLIIKQEKALSIRNYLIIEKSKRAEADLERWQKITGKEDEPNQPKNSDKLMKYLNEQLSVSSSRKSLLLKEEQPSIQAVKIFSSRQLFDDERFKNPEINHSTMEVNNRYVSRSAQRASRKSLRVSTEGQVKKKQDEQSILEKSLMKTADKEERINEARYIKHYLQQRKRKLQLQKEESKEKIRLNNLSNLRMGTQERNLLLQQKFRNSKIKMRNKKNSLPEIRGIGTNKNKLAVAAGEQWRKPRPSQPQFKAYEPISDRLGLVIEQIKDVSMLMHRRRKS